MSNEPAYMISAYVVRRGFLQPKIAEITITDGKDEWTFDTAQTFTISELKARFPHFNAGRKVER